MTVTIFGSSGFIGKNLSKSLREEFNVLEVSLRNPLWETEIDEKTDIFINLVGKAHDHKGVATDEEYYVANVEIAQKIFSVFQKSSAKMLIHISSLAAIEEYESVTPICETAPCRPVSTYGKTKRICEEWLLGQNLIPQKKLIIIRPPMVHGPGDRGNLDLLYKIISKGIPYPLAAFRNQRSFISVNNFIFYIRQIMLSSQKLETGIYHIADDMPVDTREIIEIIRKTENIKSRDLYLPKILVKTVAKMGDVIPIPLNSKKLKKLTNNLIVSNEKINTLLEINNLPLTAREGLELTIKSFRK